MKREPRRTAASDKKYWEKYNTNKNRGRPRTEIVHQEEEECEASPSESWEFLEILKEADVNASGQSPRKVLGKDKLDDEWCSDLNSPEVVGGNPKRDKASSAPTQGAGKGKSKKSKLPKKEAKKKDSKKKNSNNADSDDSDPEMYKFRASPGVVERFKVFLEEHGHLPTKDSIAAYQKWVAENPDIKEELDAFFSNDKVQKKYSKYRLDRENAPWLLRIPFMGKLAVVVIVICLCQAFSEVFN